MKTTTCFLWFWPALAIAQGTTTDTAPAWTTGVVTEDGTCGAEVGWVCSPTWGACCSKDNTCGRSSKFCGDGCQAAFGNCNVKAPVTVLGPGSVSPDGSCGGTNGYICKGSTFGDCCSAQGWCGSDAGHCNAGCQTPFGTCNEGFENVSVDGNCGTNGKTCKGSTFGDCCSAQDYCGSQSHCDAGCQTAFGTCSSGADLISTDGHCGSNGKTCKGSAFGICCSKDGYCGDKSHCDAGCQPSFGTCSAGADVISTDGNCGLNGKTCKGSAFGDCCSSQGYCGSKSAFCDAGCQTAFGSCSDAASKISTDGRCGSANGKTCVGSTFGSCCSAQGYCGDKKEFCYGGCQTAFGTCAPGSDKISTDGACRTNGKTCYMSSFGDCCSAQGFCGSTTAFCGTGCKADSGICEFPTNASEDGKCGPQNGKLCLGSGFGDCCSSYGSCGSSKDHCGQGCQKGYGSCK